MSVEHTILGIISLAPCSGYDMKAEVEQGAIGMLSALGFGSIYPRLKQLEQDGLVEVQQTESDGRNKKVYELTTKGWQELIRWLEEEPGYPLPIRDDLLLKMLFWGAAGTERAKLIEHLQKRQEESDIVLQCLAGWLNDGVTFIDEFVQLVFIYMQKRLEAENSWIELAIAQLKEPAQLPTQDQRWLAVLQKSRRMKAFEQG